MVDYCCRKVMINKIDCDKNVFSAPSSIITRHYLEIPLRNEGDLISVFTLMNPSCADKKSSDNTVNFIINYAYDILKASKIIITNIHPFYEPNSTKLRPLLQAAQKLNPKEFELTYEKNRSLISDYYSNANEIYIATGNYIRKKPHDTIISMLRQHKEKTFGLEYNGWSHFSTKNCVYHPSRKGKDPIKGRFPYFKTN
ncbi:DUF1643 domain-containing protein [Bacillus subtilis]|uniref:DUF1643 domain-containing protein n=1 Tax=Bacillus subtilis TaxID=1423 RepID=UPI00352551A7